MIESNLETSRSVPHSHSALGYHGYFVSMYFYLSLSIYLSLKPSF